MEMTFSFYNENSSLVVPLRWPSSYPASNIPAICKGRMAFVPIVHPLGNLLALPTPSLFLTQMQPLE